MRRLLLAGCAVLTLAVGVALAQNVQQNLTGSEAWEVGQTPGGQGVYTNTVGMRGQTYQPLYAGTTVGATVSPFVSEVIITGAITTLNLSLPAAPFDTQTVRITCPGGAVTTLNISGYSLGGSSTVGNAFSSCNNSMLTSMSAMYTFSSSSAAGQAGTGGTWYRVQ